jgi:hypothetical protein
MMSQMPRHNGLLCSVVKELTNFVHHATWHGGMIEARASATGPIDCLLLGPHHTRPTLRVGLHLAFGMRPFLSCL